LVHIYFIFAQGVSSPLCISKTTMD